MNDVAAVGFGPIGRVRSQDYRDLDRAGLAGDAIAHMDELHADPFIAYLKRWTYSLLGIGPGKTVLDLGCGAGDDVIAIARLVSRGGTSVGVDLSKSMIVEASRRAAADGGTIELLAGDGAALPFATGAFDAVRAERVLQHVEDPVAALAEMVRVLKPGGRALVADADRGVFAQDFDGWDADTSYRLGRWAAEHGPVRNGLFSRQVRRHMMRLGLADVVAHPAVNTSTAELLRRPHIIAAHHEQAVQAGVLTRAEADVRTAAVHAALSAGTLQAVTLFWVTVGTKPG